MNDNTLVICDQCNPPVPLVANGKDCWCPKCGKTWDDIVKEMERLKRLRASEGF